MEPSKISSDIFIHLLINQLINKDYLRKSLDFLCHNLATWQLNRCTWVGTHFIAYKICIQYTLEIMKQDTVMLDERSPRLRHIMHEYTSKRTKKNIFTK